MEQHRGGSGYEAGRRLKCWGGLPCGAQCALHLPQGGPGLLNATQGQIGKGVDQAGRQLCPQIRTGKIALRLSGRRLRVPAEVVILRQGDVPLRPLLHGLHSGQALSGHKGRIHQRHKGLPGCLDRRPGRGLHGRRLVPLPVPGPAQVLRLGGVRGDRPGAAEFLRPLNAALCTQFLNQALGHAPSFRRLSNRFVAVHAVPAFSKIPAHRSAAPGIPRLRQASRDSAFSALYRKQAVFFKGAPASRLSRRGLLFKSAGSSSEPRRPLFPLFCAGAASAPMAARFGGLFLPLSIPYTNS